MESTSNSNVNKDSKKNGFGRFFSNIFGGEFLIRKSMRPWYLYGIFVLVLITLLVISEQRIRVKQKKIIELENAYKLEISELKANNQFIPYEKTKILIQNMQEKGFITDEKQIFTVKESKKTTEKRHFFRRKKGKKDEK